MAQKIFGLEADRLCGDTTLATRAYVAGMLGNGSPEKARASLKSPDRRSQLRDALDDVKLQLHLHRLQVEVFRRCLAAEECELQHLMSKQTEIMSAMDTVHGEQRTRVVLPDEIILDILSLAHEAEGGKEDTTLWRLLRLPGLSENWRFALRSLTTHSACETFGSHTSTAKDGTRRDAKLYKALKGSAPAKLDLSFFSCNPVSVGTALEFSDRFSSLHFRSSYSAPAVVNALVACKDVLPNIRHLAVEMTGHKERPGESLFLPDDSWSLYGEGESIRPLVRSASIFLPFLGGLSALLRNVEDLEVLLPVHYTEWNDADWESAKRTLASLPSLVRLKISPSKIYQKRRAEYFTDDQLHSIASSGPVCLTRLRTLQVNFDLRTAEAIVAFINCPSLASLRLNTGESEFARGRPEAPPSQSLLEAVDEAYPALKKLSIQKSDDRLVKALATPRDDGRWLFPALTSLDLPTPSPSLISPLLDFVQARMRSVGATTPIHQLKITSPSPMDRNCRLELSALSLLVPDLITKRKSSGAKGPEAQLQSYCRVQ